MVIISRREERIGVGTTRSFAARPSDTVASGWSPPAAGHARMMESPIERDHTFNNFLQPGRARGNTMGNPSGHHGRPAAGPALPEAAGRCDEDPSARSGDASAAILGPFHGAHGTYSKRSSVLSNRIVRSVSVIGPSPVPSTVKETVPLTSQLHSHAPKLRRTNCLNGSDWCRTMPRAPGFP
jgi:hypothetical protein